MQNINEMLNKLPANQRKSVLNIMNGQTIANVYCNSKTCKNRLIGTIDKSNKFNAIVDKDGMMHARASRPRLDGYLGFQCWCGNDSRLASQEKGVKGIEQNAVTKNDIDQVFKNLEKSPANYEIKNNKQKIDGFTIEYLEVK